MNIVTHGLGSLALARGFFPQRGWGVAAGMIVAGTLADADGLSELFGPSAFVRWHRTYTHSLIGTLCVVAIGALVAVLLRAKKRSTPVWIVAAMFAAAVGHLLLDLGQSEGVTLLWPFSDTRFAADLFPATDVWILALLIVGLLIPELFRLVSSEIGVKDKNPHGRNGAILALAAIVIYSGARYLLHASALTEIDAHAYKGESPRRTGAFADSLSIFTWHGVVETQSMICTMDVGRGPGAQFDPESATCPHKPEPSPALELAQKTDAVREFLRVARFPRASVDKTQDGYEVDVRSMRDVTQVESRPRIEAHVFLSTLPNVVADELVWAKDAGRR